MRSLFARIWLTFWAVLVLTFVAALAAAFLIRVRQAEEIDQLSPVALAQEAGAAISAGGDDALRSWILRTHNVYPELDVFVVDPHGRELRGRSPAEVARAFASARDGRPFPAVVALKRPDGVYRLAFVRTGSLVFDLWDVLLQPYVLAVLIVAMSGAGAALLARSLSRPVVSLRANVRRFADGDLGMRMGPKSTLRHDELGALARDFDEMAARLEELVASKEALLRDVSHELRSPLARLRIASDMGRRRATNDGAVAEYDTIDREVARLDELIGQILSYSRLGHGKVSRDTRVDLRLILEAAVEDARFEAAPQDKEVALAISSSARVAGDAALLTSAIDNVLRNAVRFAPRGSSIRVSLEIGPSGAAITVRDDGPGLPEGEVGRIFDGIRSNDGGGLGLGLPITKRIIALHGGEVSAANVAGGFEVKLVLPLVGGG